MKRRDSLKLISLAPVAAGFSWTGADLVKAQEQHTQHLVQTAGQEFVPAFFTPHEYETVEVLVDLILPADERSGSATDAGVPAFMDFMMTDRPSMQIPMRGGLAWMDYQCQKRYQNTFVGCDDAQRRALLDDIAFPEIADPSLSQGVAFFNSFRDLTASGFWTSKMGMDDVQYVGNTTVPNWNGCPQEVLNRLGVSYDEG